METIFSVRNGVELHTFKYTYDIHLPWYTPLHTCYALIHTTCLETHHYTPYMSWYMPLHTLYELIHATKHPICLSATSTPLTYLSTHHCTFLYLGTYCYTPFMPWYTPLHTLLHTFVHTTTNPICIGTHYYSPHPWYTPLTTSLVHTNTSLVHTTTHLICLDTHYIPWYTPLHTLYALIHITTRPTCFGTHHYNHIASTRANLWLWPQTLKKREQNRKEYKHRVLICTQCKRSCGLKHQKSQLCITNS